MAVTVVSWTPNADWNGTSPETIDLSWSAGDLILVGGHYGLSTANINTPTATGLTFRLVAQQDSGVGTEAVVALFAARAGSAGAGVTVTLTASSTTGPLGMHAYVISGSQWPLVPQAPKLTENSYTAVPTWIGQLIGNLLTDFTAAAAPGLTASAGVGTVTERADVLGDLGAEGYGAWVVDWANGTTQATATFGATAFTGLTVAQLIFALLPQFSPIVQQSARWGLDDGSESAHTWAAAQDTNLTAPIGTNLARFLLQTSADYGAFTPVLRHRINGAGSWQVTPIGSATPTLAYGASGAAGYGQAAEWQATYPTGITRLSELIMVIGSKPTTANDAQTPIIENGERWTLIGSITGANDGDTGGYGTTLAADTGNTNLWIYRATEVTGAEVGQCVFQVPGSSVTTGSIHRFEKSAPCEIEFAIATGKDTVAGNLSAVTGALGLAPGDQILAALIIPTDVTTPSQFTVAALAATGVTFGTVTEIVELDTTTGNDLGGLIVRSSVSTGTTSTAVTFSATAAATNTNVRGPVAVLRMRPLAPKVYIPTSANIAAGGEATTSRLTGGSGTFTTGRRWDDENGVDTIDIAASGNTEVEWPVAITSALVNGDFVDLQCWIGPAPAAQTFTPRWTIGAAGPTNLPLDAATESDTAGALTATKAVALAGVSEADAVGGAALSKILALGGSTETDSAGGLTVRKLVALTAVAEAGTAGTVETVGVVALGGASEASAAGAVTVAKLVALGPAAEADAPGGVTVAEIVTLASTAETVAAGSVAVVRVVALGAAVESGAAGALAAAKTLTAAGAGETDSAGAVSVRKTVALGAASEVDTAGAVAVAAVVGLPAVSVTDTAGPVTVGKVVRLGAVSEVDTAGDVGIAGDGTIALGAASEVDTAGAVVVVKRLPLSHASESDQVGALALTRALALSGVSESTSAGPAGVAVLLRGGSAGEVSSAGGLGLWKLVALTAAIEVDTAGAVDVQVGPPPPVAPVTSGVAAAGLISSVAAAGLGSSVFDAGLVSVGEVAGL